MVMLVASKKSVWLWISWNFQVKVGVWGTPRVASQ
jgi:hypothetical protein